MRKDYESLFAEMIALARITDGNEHLITPDSTELLRSCLEKMASQTADAGELIERIVEEKRKMVPDCFLCANPCGKTFPFDFRELPEGEVGALKYAILEALCRNPGVEEALLYRALAIISFSDYEKEDLIPILREIG